MTYRLQDAAGLVALALAIAGCSSDDEKSPGSGGTSGGAGSGGSGGTSGSAGSGGSGGTSGSAGSGGSGATVTATGTVSEILTLPAGGVEVCVLDEPGVPCATTDAQGKYTLPGVPANAAEGGLTYAKSGYLSTAVLGSTGTEDLIYDVVLASDTAASALASALGITWPDPENAVLAFAVSTSPDDGGTGAAPLDGVSVSISPASGEGPFYQSSTGTPDTSLAATSTLGTGFITGLPPGDYDLTFTHTTKTSCQRTGGWESSKPNSAKIRSLANFLVTGGPNGEIGTSSSGTMRCD